MAVVIDTNCVLDLWVFQDPAATALRAALMAGQVRWFATSAMRAELARVLDYPQIAARLAPHGPATAHDVLAAFDRWAALQETAPRAPVRCRDPDDQCFIDLAVQHRTWLLSKDARVTGLARRLVPLGVRVQRHWP